MNKDLSGELLLDYYQYYQLKFKLCYCLCKTTQIANGKDHIYYTYRIYKDFYTHTRITQVKNLISVGVHKGKHHLCFRLVLSVKNEAGKGHGTSWINFIRTFTQSMQTERLPRAAHSDRVASPQPLSSPGNPLHLWSARPTCLTCDWNKGWAPECSVALSTQEPPRNLI